MASISFSSIDPSKIITVGPTTIGAVAIGAGPNNIQPARGTFLVEINDVAAGSILRVTISGGLSRTYGNPSAIYIVVTNSGLNSTNLTVNDVGTANTGNAQTTIVVTDTTTTSQYTLIYIPSTTGNTNLPTIQNTGGAAPAGNVQVSTTYMNCSPIAPVQNR